MYIYLFKHSESKLYHGYTVNVCPEIANPDSMEAENSYLDLPMDVKFSLEGNFLSVSTFNGDVKVFKMPTIISPMKEDDPSQQQQQQVPSQ